MALRHTALAVSAESPTVKPLLFANGHQSGKIWLKARVEWLVSRQ